MSWLSPQQVADLGFLAVGDDVKISDRASIYGADRIRIGSHVRIDDFAIITADQPVTIGSYCHISARAFVGGTHGIDMGDFVNLSVGSCVFTSCDDTSGNHLLGPTIPEQYRGPTNAKVIFESISAVGANSVVLPGVRFAEGSGIGALTLAHKSLEPWTLYLGVPMRKLKRTTPRLKIFAEELLATR